MDDRPDETDTGPVVLVVDDNELVRSMCEVVLDRSGYDVVAAVSADDAMACLGERPDIAVVISDISMPGSRDGWALLAELRSTHPELGLIVMSGNPGSTGRDLDGVRLLSKPFTVDDLTDAVRAVLPR